MNFFIHHFIHFSTLSASRSPSLSADPWVLSIPPFYHLLQSWLPLFPPPQCLICHMTSFTLFLPLSLLILGVTSRFLPLVSLCLTPVTLCLLVLASQSPPCWFVSAGCVLEQRSDGFPIVWRVSPQAAVVCMRVCVCVCIFREGE